MNQHRLRGPATAVAALMAASGLTACGAGGGSGGGNELHVLVGANTAHAAAQRAWFAHLQKEFKARTGAKVSFDTFASAGDEQTKIQTSMVSGTGPDVYGLGTTFNPVAYATGGFHVLSAADWRKIGGRDKFLPASLEMSGPDARHDIGVPTAARPYGMVYNTKMFKAAGIKSAPTTWDQFVADTERLNHPSSGTYGTAIDYADPFDPWKYVWSMTLLSGGQLLNKGLTKAELNSPQVNKAVDDFFDLRTKDHVVDPASAGWQSAQATSAFARGKAAILPMVSMPSVAPTLNSSPVKGDYAYAPMPMVPFGATSLPANGTAAGSIVSGDDMAVASYSKHLDLALDYIALITSPAEQIAYNKAFGDLPTVSTAAQRVAGGSPKTAAFLSTEKSSVPTSFTGAWSAVQLGLTNVITQSLPALAKGRYNPSTVRTSLNQANQSTQSALSRQKH